MTFLNTGLLFGAALLAVPLIIHLLNRRRHRTVEWGAMHLLDSVVHTNRRRLQLDQLLLLLLRCAIPVALAVCLARPVLTKFRSLAGDAPISLVLLLDDSYSMDARSGDRTRLDAARDAALAIAESAAPGSDVTVIRTGSEPRPLPGGASVSIKPIRERLLDATAAFGPSDIAAALDEAVAAAAGGRQPRREIVVVGDFQVADWEPIRSDTETWARRLTTSDLPPAVTLLPIGVGDSPSDNLAVERIAFATRPLASDQRLDIRATIRSRSRSDATGATVSLLVDNALVDRRRVDVSVGGQAQALFRHRFERAGSHAIRIAIEAGDAIAADDSREAVVIVWDRLPVLLVDGAPSSEPLGGETDYLSIALAPLSLTQADLADLIETRVVSAERLVPDDLDASRLVVLANVGSLTERQSEAVVDYVRGGGSLLVTGGQNVGPRLDEALTDGDAVLLPRSWGETADRTGEPARILTQRYEHPALAVFNDDSYGDLSVATIRRFHRLGPERPRPSADDDEPRPADGEVVALTLDRGEPLLVERPFGAGLVMQLATTVDADWSDLPRRPIFVPLMQQLAAQLATRVSPPRNVRAGEPIVALFEAPHATVDVVSPDGTRRSIATEPQTRRQHVARFADTARPGLYRMQPRDGGETTSLLYAATADPQESDDTRLDRDEILALADDLGATVADSAEAYRSRDRERRYGRDVWKVALTILLVFLLAEPVLAQWIASRQAS